MEQVFFFHTIIWYCKNGKGILNLIFMILPLQNSLVKYLRSLLVDCYSNFKSIQIVINSFIIKLNFQSRQNSNKINIIKLETRLNVNL